MSTVSLRIRDDLKHKVQEIAKRGNVSLNNYVNATLAAAVAQEETLSFFHDRLRDIDLKSLHARTMAFMGKTKPGDGPSERELRNALGERY